MTIFCGAYSLDPRHALPDDLLAQLRRHVSRASGDQPTEYHSGRAYLAQVDIGAFAGEGMLRDAHGSCTLVAGEPLLIDGDNDPAWNRNRDLALLHSAFGADDPNAALRRAAGTFCGAHHDAARDEITLFVDKLGVRPLYLWVGPHFVVFATALRILEAVPQVTKRFDLRGVTEIASLSYALADRTPYAGISMLRAGEAVRVGSGGAQRALYWHWDGPTEELVYEDGVKRGYDAFMAAIARRQRRTGVAAAFLSGGLDSRVIVGGLAAGGNQVHTVNYAPDGSQDQVFGQLVADQLQLRHTQIETNADNVNQGYRKDAVRAWIRATFPSGKPPVLWSGDGGSVGLGHVYITPQIVAAMERGAIDAATYLFTQGVPQRIITRASVGQVAELACEGVTEELTAIHSPDPGRRFHLFLMFNDQRRHLAQHFEDIDLERIEFHLPFFDAEFMASVLRLPNDWFMAHRYYMDWLKHFPNQLDAIPWQAYPGHIPCTLPSPPGLKYQWDVYYDKKMYAQMRRAQAAEGHRMLAAPRFPDHLISRPVLRLASMLTASGLRDYGYLIKTAGIYQRYWAATEDQHAA